ncbi:MAG: YlbF family regulator [Firmicutes bacterium HGW-Firmicutes-14]|jgi:cell fate (sporulation/competence/biofilm development) regulator YlbF (YheA/YmcA/DUF963 family)|nr:MAG: YlbF family regulator [Firmicutes bacterium HGW-Firmicutes-14]
MSAEIMEKANELAAAIAESPELADMREKEKEMNQNPEAVVIINEFREKQQQVYDIQMRGEEIDDNDKQDIAAIESKMNSNPAIRSYIEASEKFENLLRSVNLIVSKAIAGEQGCGCGPNGMADCGPECGTECGSGCGCS